MKRLDHYWYSNNPLSILLLPVAWLFCALVELRRWGYRLGLLRSNRLPVPVIVVGNISVGGTGKTPLVIALAELLRKNGYRPGIISRGYGGKSDTWPQAVTADSDPGVVGDEPVLIAAHTGCPMAVGPDRVAAAYQLLATKRVDVIISDDGLQHYRLARDIEIAVIDGQRRFGNGHCLPAGPLRERQGRLKSVDMRITNGVPRPGECTLKLRIGDAVPLAGTDAPQPTTHWRGKPVHAVAGIGHPQRFFDNLTALGLKVTAHPFDDHHAYTKDDLMFGDDMPVLMTEKDAVKCRAFADGRLWYVPVTAELQENFSERLLSLLKRKHDG